MYRLQKMDRQSQTLMELRQDTTEDMKLVVEVLRKDRKATAEFVSRYTDSVYAYVRRRVMPQTEVAEDLVLRSGAFGCLEVALKACLARVS